MEIKEKYKKPFSFHKGVRGAGIEKNEKLFKKSEKWWGRKRRERWNGRQKRGG